MTTKILRPNAAGDETNLTPGEGSNYQEVDEVVADDSTTRVYNNKVSSYQRDLYNLPASAISDEPIIKITLHFRVMNWGIDGNTVKGVIKSNSTVTETAEKNPYSDFGNSVWGTYSQDWTTNPADSEAWEWSDIADLQIGVSLKADASHFTYCTQVYVVVDYVPVEIPTKESKMDLTEMLGLLVIDLKMTLDTEISTAEGTRAINRAVDETSRHIPRERIYDHTWIKAVTDDSFTTPAALSTTSIVSAEDISASTDGDTATLVTSWNDVPRPVYMTLTDANNHITRMTVIVKGTDADGVYREERFYRHNGKLQTGKIYFSSIYEVEVNEIAGNSAGETLSIGTAAPDLATGGIWIQLSNPVEPASEGIYSAASKGGTKYTLNTDYEMDYANGRIRMKNGGTLAVSTAYYANYNRASTSIDISSIVPELIRITKVLYPANKVPEQQVGISIWENMLTIGSLRPGVSQEALTDKEHIAIYYEARHAPPTFVGPGSYPELLDEVVLTGAAGFALLMEALQYELQAVTDLASVRTELGKVTVLVTASTGKIDLALTKVALYLETSGTTDNAKDVLANITDDIANLRDAIHKTGSPDTGALFKMLTHLDEVDTTDLADATDGAEKMISVGHPLINVLNDGGPDVSSKYADFARANIQVAQVRTQAALGYAQEAQIRLANIQSYIGESGAWMRMGETFIAEAQSLIAEVNSIIAEATQYHETAGLDLLLADRFRAEAQSRLNDFRTVLSSKSEYRKKVVSIPVRQPS